MKDIDAVSGPNNVLAAVIEVFGDWSCCDVCRKVWGKKYNPCPSPKPSKHDERVDITCFQAFGFWRPTEDIITIPKVCLKGWMPEEQYNQVVNGEKPVTTEVECFFDIDLLNNMEV